MDDKIAVFDLKTHHQRLKKGLLALLEQAIDEAAFIGGPSVVAFEEQFAAFCEASGCVGVANGTDALMLSLRCAGVGQGDRVIVPAFTFIATAEAVSAVGATPQLVDVDAKTLTLDVAQLERTSLHDVKAIVPVHLYGQAAPMQDIVRFAQRHDLVVIEDAAQAHGARHFGRSVGSLGHFGCFSFYPAKNLGALGDGGAVVACDPARLERVRVLANHGRAAHDVHVEPGFNSRLDAMAAAVLRYKLDYLPMWNAARVAHAQCYRQALQTLSGLWLPEVGEGNTHVYHLFVIGVQQRHEVREFLKKRGIETAVHYPTPIHLHKAYQNLGYEAGSFPVAERAAAQVLSLPLFPEMTSQQLERVVFALEELFKAGG